MIQEIVEMSEGKQASWANQARQAVADSNKEAIAFLMKLAPRMKRACDGASKVKTHRVKYAVALEAVKLGPVVAGSDAEINASWAILQSSQRKVNALVRIQSDLVKL